MDPGWFGGEDSVRVHLALSWGRHACSAKLGLLHMQVENLRGFKFVPQAAT